MSLKRIPVIENEYQPLEDLMNQQLKVFWLADEIKVEKDIQDVLVNFSEAERHGVISTLKLFTIYEDYAGEEFWGGRFKAMYSDNTAACRMASAFSMFENCVHAPFYSKINELLHLDNPEFYLSYLDNEFLRGRVAHIDSIVSDPEDMVALGMFSLVEGVILYSSFAFLMHFQNQGKNKLSNVGRGINFSVRDENLHAIAAAWCFRHRAKQKTAEELAAIKAKIVDGATHLFEHESHIVDMLFEKGRIEGITEHQLKTFVQSRINECLKNLEIEPIYTIKDNPIASWFYRAINNYQFNDIFAGQGREYNRNWGETDFVWTTAEEAGE